MNKELAVKDLQAIVDQFNAQFDTWTQTYDARVSFGWKYGKEQVKLMEIVGIDQIIYRKPPPKSLTEIMDVNKGAESPSENAV